MRVAWLAGVLFVLSSCSNADRSHLLTYEHPRAESPVTVARTQPSAPAKAEALRALGESPPRPAPSEPVIVGTTPPIQPTPAPPVATVEAPSSQAVPATPPSPIPAASSDPPAGSAQTSTALDVAIVPADTTPESPSRVPAAQLRAEPPPTVREAAPVIAAAPEPAASVAAASPAAPPQPQVVYLKPQVSAPGQPASSRRPVAAMVRPAPPPDEAAPPAPPIAVPSSAPSSAAPMPVLAGSAAAAPAAIAASPTAEAHCKDVAQQRKRDAAANGYEEDMQKQIFSGTYKTCMDWAAQHS
jgi:hypothetical protein